MLLDQEMVFLLIVASALTLLLVQIVIIDNLDSHIMLDNLLVLIIPPNTIAQLKTNIDVMKSNGKKEAIQIMILKQNFLNFLQTIVKRKASKQ